jgi:hypothetical protein
MRIFTPCAQTCLVHIFEKSRSTVGIAAMKDATNFDSVGIGANEE